MKPRAMRSVMAILGTTSLLLATAALDSGALAKDSHARGCSNASLNGSYGFYRSGTTAAGPLAGLGSLTFDGIGNVTGSQSISRNGVFQFDIPIAGPYVVNADCSGRFLAPDGVTEIARVVVTDGGKGFYFMSETAGNAVHGVARRIESPDDDD